VTGARIMVEMPHVRPVIAGVWHTTRLSRFPASGEPVTTLCGLTEPAGYSDQSSTQLAVPCWECDRRYRTENHLTVPPNHPAFRGNP